MLENEQELLENSRAGDVEAFEKLMEGYQKKVFNLVLRMMGNQEDACELTQEVFIRIYRSIRGFKGESALATWIYRIATNICLDELRKRKNKKVISLEQELDLEEGSVGIQMADQGPGPQEVLERKELKETVEKAIASLSGEHRTIIILRELQGLSYEQIGEILLCPAGTVKSRINRARQELKEILKRNKELFGRYYVK